VSSERIFGVSSKQPLLPRVVSEPDAEVLDLEGLALGNLLHADDLSGRLLELTQLTQEVPESGSTKQTAT
jgi:hypothetical protein